MKLSELKELANEWKLIVSKNPRYKAYRYIWNKDYTEVREIEFMLYLHTARIVWEDNGYKINKKDYCILQKIINNVKREV